MARTMHPVIYCLYGALLAGVLQLTACAPSRENPLPPPEATAQTQPGIISGDGVSRADVDACTAKGGALQPTCRMGKLSCVITYSDAGKPCSDGAQCQSGFCLAETTGAKFGEPTKGQCRATNNPCGCSTPIQAGKAGPTMCVD